MAFLKLPPELRLQVYRHILDPVNIPVPRKLYEYHGILLSCRLIYEEFGSEALKIINQFLVRIQQKWPSNNQPLRMPSAIHLGDAAQICIGIPYSFLIPRTQQAFLAVDVLLELLLENLPSFTIYVWNNGLADGQSSKLSSINPIGGIHIQLRRLTEERGLGCITSCRGNVSDALYVPLLEDYHDESVCVFMDYNKKVIRFDANYGPEIFETELRKSASADEARLA
ncbi:uncharacterized protein K460DRAFT_403985 [Cucurbitaria berberidis CBS 394.84]|uniref:Uncharacterized protein n=1 Tax=Cucurbitaria berberidis CBS 394.84 TaxID=1168544 RepID=A0A9P4GNK3_9PLEO|nr:uncharacterized protein K460DRAFT_403985 [Cucurbitaria berberidis CBS 394.84]KAF1848714.1 hypothetical protein K460DRAFT_403985 [Cucurbitaria berberidis CBS 394.84]